MFLFNPTQNIIKRELCEWSHWRLYASLILFFAELYVSILVLIEERFQLINICNNDNYDRSAKNGVHRIKLTLCLRLFLLDEEKYL